MFGSVHDRLESICPRQHLVHGSDVHRSFLSWMQRLMYIYELVMGAQENIYVKRESIKLTDGRALGNPPFLRWHSTPKHCLDHRAEQLPRKCPKMKYLTMLIVGFRSTSRRICFRMYDVSPTYYARPKWSKLWLDDFKPNLLVRLSRKGDIPRCCKLVDLLSPSFH